MHAYSQRKEHSPASLAAAVAINGAVLAALFTATPHVEKMGPTIMDVFTRPAAPDPEPLPPEPLKRDPAPSANPHAPDRVVDIAPPKGPVIETSHEPVIEFTGTLTGTGDDPVVVDSPVEPTIPALVAATPDPRYLSRFQPDYPVAKRRAEEEGALRVRFLIGADGRVKAIEAVGDADPEFFAATRRQALSQWRFRPATRGGVAVESWQTRTVRFVLTQ